LQGVKFEVADGRARMVATDGSRIALREADCDGELDVLIPKKALAQATKLPKETVSIGITTNHIFFKTENYTVSSTRLTGEFPNYKMITDLDLPNVAVVSKQELKDAVDQAFLISDSITHGLKLTFKEGELDMEATSTDGEFEDTLDLDYEGDEFKVAVNSTYLRDFLNAVPSESVQINFNIPTQPLKLSDGTNDYKCLVMPMRF